MQILNCHYGENTFLVWYENEQLCTTYYLGDNKTKFCSIFSPLIMAMIFQCYNCIIKNAYLLKLHSIHYILHDFRLFKDRKVSRTWRLKVIMLIRNFNFTYLAFLNLNGLLKIVRKLEKIFNLGTAYTILAHSSSQAVCNICLLCAINTIMGMTGCQI